MDTLSYEQIAARFAFYANAKVRFTLGNNVLDGTIVGLAAGDHRGRFIITHGPYRYAVPYKDVRIARNDMGLVEFAQ